MLKGRIIDSTPESKLAIISGAMRWSYREASDYPPKVHQELEKYREGDLCLIDPDIQDYILKNRLGKANTYISIRSLWISQVISPNPFNWASNIDGSIINLKKKERVEDLVFALGFNGENYFIAPLRETEYRVIEETPKNFEEKEKKLIEDAKETIMEKELKQEKIWPTGIFETDAKKISDF